MEPIRNAPSLGTLYRDSTRFFTVAIILLSPLWMAIAILLSPHLVTIRAAWFKQPKRNWRAGVVVSIVISVIAVAIGALWVFPGGVPIPIPTATDESTMFQFIPTPIIHGLNAMFVAGIPMLPLAFASSRHTIKNSAVINDLRVN